MFNLACISATVPRHRSQRDDVDVLVINYRNHVGGLVNEVLHMNGAGMVAHGSGTYLTADAAGASGA